MFANLFCGEKFLWCTLFIFYTTKKEIGKQNLRIFGELAVVATGRKNKIKGKLENRGELYFFTGYSKDRAADVYRMVKISSGKVTNSRNGTFLGKMFGDVYETENFRAFKSNEANNLDSSIIEINIENEK